MGPRSRVDLGNPGRTPLGRARRQSSGSRPLRPPPRHLLLRRTRRDVGDGLVRQPRLGALRRSRTSPDRGRLCPLLQSRRASPLGLPGAQGPGRPPLHPGGLDDAAGNLRFRADDGDVAATRSWCVPELLRVGEGRMVLYGGWDDSGGTDRPPVRPIPIPHLPSRVRIVVHVHGSHAAHLRTIRLHVESALVGLALVRPCISRRFLSRRSPHAGRLCVLGIPLRHARLLGRALSDGEPERSQQAPLLSHQHRADADLGTAGPPRLHRLRRPRCVRLFESSRLHRLQGLAPLPVRALGPRAGDHLAWNLLPASPNPDRGSDRRTSAGGYSGVHAMKSLPRRGGRNMRFRPWTSALRFVLAGSLLLTGSVASAGPKEDVGAATMKWGQTLGQNDPDKVVLLYATDGVLWGTLSPTVRADRAALRDYFVTAFRVLPGLKVTFGEQLIRVYGGTAVNTGYYTFSYIKDGETKTLPARYSFTFVKEGESWMIVDHHSSAMPAPLR